MFGPLRPNQVRQTIVKTSPNLLCEYTPMRIAGYILNEFKWIFNIRPLVALYGAPFVTSILLLTEANFVQQKSLLSDKSNFVYDKRTKLLLSTKVTFVEQKYFCRDKICFCQQK